MERRGVLMVLIRFLMGMTSLLLMPVSTNNNLKGKPFLKPNMKHLVYVFTHLVYIPERKGFGGNQLIHI